MRKLTLGRVDLYLLDDGTLRYPASAFFANVPQALWREKARADREGNIPVGHNCALVRTPSDLIVIDTGYGDDTHGGATGHLLEDFARTGYRPDQVSIVVSTHAHGDHIQRNTLLRDGKREPTFPHARYHLAAADWAWFNGPARVREFDQHIVTLERLRVLTRFEAELRLTPEVVLLPTPGHTPGHTSVLIEGGSRRAIFLGDLCHHPLHFAHPDWVSRFDVEPGLTPRTRQALFERAVEADALVICPHALAPGLGKVHRTGIRFHWTPVG